MNKQQEYNKEYRKNHPEYMREWRKNHPNYMNEYNRKWRKTHQKHIREQIREYNRKWQKNHPERNKVDSKVYAQRHPKIIKAQRLAQSIARMEKCQFGGSNHSGRLERVHMDYDCPLEVLTMCLKHHRLVDRLYRRND